MTRSEKNLAPPECYCGLPLFLDGDTWLCPARFDGTHSVSREREELAQQAQLSIARSTAGALGGTARAQNLTRDTRRRIAQQAAKARWAPLRSTKKVDR